MVIGIDARMYGPKQGGLGRYIEQLVLNLERDPCATAEAEGGTRSATPEGAQDDKRNEFVVFLRSENWNDYTPSKPNFRKVLTNIPWYGWREQLFLSKIIQKEKVDLMHFPHWNVPLFYNAPFIVTIHDLLLLHYPTRRASTLGPLTYWFKNKMFRRVLDHAAKKSKHILTISEFSKQDIVKTLGVKPEKITVTYPAPFNSPLEGGEGDVRHRSPTSPGRLGDHPPQGGITILGITKPYVLYVGVAFPHKNLNTLIEAWKLFQEKYGDNYQLVLAGKKNYFYKKLRLSPIAYRLSRSVIFTDFIPDSGLPELYTHASLFVFPSLYEGFGIPPLEALGFGVPVVAANSTCLPEVLGDAALFIDPHDPAALAAAMHRALTDEPLRKQILSASNAVLKRYSWATLAQKTRDVYTDQKRG